MCLPRRPYNWPWACLQATSPAAFARGVASEVVMAHTARSALALQGGGALGAYEYGTRIVLSLGRVTF